MSGLFALIPETMGIAIWAMIIACILPYVFAMLAKFMGKFGMAENVHPRDASAQLTGRAARAYAAQQNSFESLPIFLASVLVAMLFFVPQSAINNLAVMYVVIRMIYGIAYIFNMPTFRSILWVLSMACCMMLFYLTIRLTAY